MMLSKLIRSSLRKVTNTQPGLCLKHIRVPGSLQKHCLGPPPLAKWNSTAASIEKDVSDSEDKGFKGHSMLAPFTAGWQTTDLHPLVIERSEGSYVYDTNGKKYLDALAGLWCNPLGGNEPRLVAAATKQLNTLPFYHSFWNRTTKPSLDLAKELLETFTASKMAKAFFTNSGSDANDTQVKLVWYYNNALGRPKKKKFIARTKSYHGSTLISASLSGLTPLHQQFDLPAPFVLHTDCPHYWRFHLPGESEEEFSTRLAKNLEDLILKEGPETIAAFIAEPVMGAGGVIPPPATYFDKIQAVVKKYDILFIADEVICGFGRLGTMFGCDMYNIKPDLVTIAKVQDVFPLNEEFTYKMNEHYAEASASSSSSLNSSSHGTEDDQEIARILAEEGGSRCDQKLGRKLSHLDSIPHTPRMIGQIPDVNDATLDHDRLSARLATYGLAELQIEGDGNCQFRALADQMFRNQDYHKHVRKGVMKQLKQNRKLYESYVPMKYRSYRRKMKKLGEWGDHITLQAAADRYEAKICLVTSFRDTCYIEILPKDKTPTRELWLSFWSEIHYNSLYGVGDVPTRVPKKKHWLF